MEGRLIEGGLGNSMGAGQWGRSNFVKKIKARNSAQLRFKFFSHIPLDYKNFALNIGIQLKTSWSYWAVKMVNGILKQKDFLKCF